MKQNARNIHYYVWKRFNFLVPLIKSFHIAHKRDILIVILYECLIILQKMYQKEQSILHLTVKHKL